MFRSNRTGLAAVLRSGITAECAGRDIPSYVGIAQRTEARVHAVVEMDGLRTERGGAVGTQAAGGGKDRRVAGRGGADDDDGERILAGSALPQAQSAGVL